jgi:hypothetical protein
VKRRKRFAVRFASEAAWHVRCIEGRRSETRRARGLLPNHEHEARLGDQEDIMRTGTTAAVVAAAAITAAPLLAHQRGGTLRGSPDPFLVQAELQGLYDEISQATLQFETESDVDQFHEVLYSPDWVFVETSGARHPWAEARQHDLQVLHARRADSMIQTIQSLSLVAGGATVAVNLTTVRTIVDDGGRFGVKGRSHTLTETTPFRDRWVTSSGKWKLASREQLGTSAVVVDKHQDFE